ncbi:hypothetical protein CJ030_MR3G025355 [Morella rubra]|uniref:Leucine-rich repeat-containing N-terminal plant-type domain-containing protein n=1 Tax=Morella rubra TaxID=262757 RepID=A0A6A1W6Q4_9ROSI|nr:hypothetical protein CJ030_MR3G025355 [Morella rubra]
MAFNPCCRILLSMTLLWVQHYLPSVANAKIPPNITTDRDALLALKARISYDPHSILANNWSTNVSVCDWVGVTCGFSHHRVTVLTFLSWALLEPFPTRRLPLEIGNLGMLIDILSNNSFEGRVPLEIGNLTMLTILYLSDNHFEGEIPSEVGNLRNLKVLNMGRNNFDGAIPFDIFNITTIRIIDLTLNKLSGHLPSNIGLFVPNVQRLFPVSEMN